VANSGISSVNVNFLTAMLRLFIATIVVFSGLGLLWPADAAFAVDGVEQGTVGIFQGMVVYGSSRNSATYIYVQGKNGNIRRVRVTGAKVYYADSVPVAQRIKSALECLQEHPEVKVTAEQAGNGEWKAQEIAIIRVSRRQAQAVLRTS
jgi:hypothetical protein